MPNKVSKPTRKPVVLNAEQVIEPAIEPVEEQKQAPIFKPVYFNVRALGWYNNGNLIDKPWNAGETRRITRELYKRIKQDLPDNWETV